MIESSVLLYLGYAMMRHSTKTSNTNHVHQDRITPRAIALGDTRSRGTDLAQAVQCA